MNRALRGGSVALLLVLAGVGCGRRDAEAPPRVEEAPTPLAPWAWHPLGGLAVVEGELAEPAELILEGPSIRERRYAERGPVRWEFFRPPEGETAVLRTADGRELARFAFSVAPPPSPQSSPRIARQAAPPAPAAEPRTRTLARLASGFVSALSPRKQPGVGLAPAAEPPPPAIPPRPPLQPAPEPEPRTRTLTQLASGFISALSPRKAPGVGLSPAAEPPPPAVPRRAPLEPAPEPEPRTSTLARLASGFVSALSPRKAPGLGLAPTPEPPPPALPKRAPVQAAPEPPPPSHTLPRQVPPSSAAIPWPGMGEAFNLTRGPGGHKRLLLSFDGGSTAEVADEVLDILKARGVRTTLFLTGAFIQRFPAVVKRMAAEGHELGNHTLSHPHFAPGMKRDPHWTRERVQRELLEADAALLRLLGRPMDPVWRAPYGEHTAEIRRWAEELGYRHVGWTEGADSLDWATPHERRLYRSGDAILQRLHQRLNRDGDGLIVLMHLGSGRTAADRPSAGLGAFMDRALGEGWTFVTAGSYLRDLGKPAWNSQQRLALLAAPGTAPQAR
ncbi:polysaccharide deacetylase family protein [Geothrix sp. 21YS21S-4]|uniref:polysaccharide deacetylase family protein n=1 Tax=Geothrix sp. 21YS21S-4 TaxID=3068889 RepID=UPI0027BA7D4E|nr:polysaccharide deacetylase family protein [Geothrix sp. 21YS21S-4]